MTLDPSMLAQMGMSLWGSSQRAPAGQQAGFFQMLQQDPNLMAMLQQWLRRKPEAQNGQMPMGWRTTGPAIASPFSMGGQPGVVDLGFTPQFDPRFR